MDSSRLRDLKGDVDSSAARWVLEAFYASAELKRNAANALAPAIAAAATTLVETLRAGGKVLCCGNGGSAADAQHFASELVNRFERTRAALPALSLCNDASVVTSIANDEAFAEVFARQVQALGMPGDTLLGLTTSGGSENILRAIAAAHERRMRVILLSGRDGGRASAMLGDSDREVRVPSDSTARVQEVHVLTIHCLCHLIETALFETATPEKP